ncbi:MAG: 50S ribosome-binding GTPase [Candidatus Helarchaeota archaeon]|nr:50S ribosome-binding GTPase [Candidatus Helarchaeota archaeon]
MDESMKEKLENIVDVPETIKTLEELVKLDLIHFKSIDVKIATTLKNVLHVETIEQLALKKITDEEFLMLKMLGISDYNLNLWNFLCRMILEGRLEKVGPAKTLIVGLDNAGKTAILHAIQNKLDLNTFDKLSPTLGVEREMIQRYGMDHILLDMGGQDTYRKQYIQNAERYFINVEFIMFVIDVQDPKRFEEAQKYFLEIINLLEVLKEQPEILIIIHKVDPDIKSKPEIQNSIQLLKNQYNETLQNKPFDYDITTFSIFNLIGDNKTMVKEIRTFITTGKGHEHKEDIVLTESLDRIMNIVINLSSMVEQRLSNLETRMDNFRQWMEYARKSEIAPMPKPPTRKIKESGKIKKHYPVNQALRDELKSILKMKKLTD